MIRTLIAITAAVALAGTAASAEPNPGPSTKQPSGRKHKKHKKQGKVAAPPPATSAPGAH